MAHMMIEFWRIVVGHDVDPLEAHGAFYRINEFRELCAQQSIPSPAEMDVLLATLPPDDTPTQPPRPHPDNDNIVPFTR